MRRKSLVVAASGPFQGPKVFLEPGEWLIALPAEGGFEVVTHGREDIEVMEHDVFKNTEARIIGPVMVSVNVYEGFKDVFVQAVQLSRS